jgi:hypothetical protein
MRFVRTGQCIRRMSQFCWLVCLFKKLHWTWLYWRQFWTLCAPVRNRSNFYIVLTVTIFHEDRVIREVTKIVDRVVEAVLYIFWLSLRIHVWKLLSRKIVIFQPFDLWNISSLYPHANCLPSPFNGLVSKYPLLYGRGFVHSRITNKILNILIVGLQRII